jgi:hypothetical protein
MLAILSPFLGIFGSLLPRLVAFLEKRQELKHEIELITLRMEMATRDAENQLVIKNIEADIAESKSVRSFDSDVDGGKFINALRASVRPVITYMFFLLFVSVKVAAAYTMIQNGDSIPVMLDAVWDDESMALFATIMAFWFGSRVLEKMGYGGMNSPRIR